MPRSERNKRITLCERGSSAVLFLLVIMPVIFLFLSLGLDLSLYFGISERMQRAADDAAMHALKYLPNAELGKQAAQALINDLGSTDWLTDLKAEIALEHDSAAVLLSARAPLHFAGWFGFKTGLPLSSYARARSVPLDVMISIDVSSSVAPDVLSGTPWGSELDWPAADFFAHEFPLYSPDRANEGHTLKVNERLLTQQCFNPVLSAEKNAAISLYRYFSSFNLNSVGIGFYPGELFALDIVRAVEKGGRRIRTAEEIGEADFNSRSGGQFSSSLMCAAAAQREFTHGAYRFSQLPDAQPVILEQGLRVNPDYLPTARSAEVIWTRAVNSSNPTSIDRVLREAHLRLFSAAARRERGGLAAAAKKMSIVLMGDLPRIGALRFPDSQVEAALRREFSALLDEVARYGTDLSLYFILVKHPSLEGEQNFENAVRELQDLTAEYDTAEEEAGALSLKVLWTANPETLSREIASALTLEKRTIMISR